MLSAQFTATIPTGSHSNGASGLYGGLADSLLAGKGYGKFDVISCLGGTLPTEETKKVGCTLPEAWKTLLRNIISRSGYGLNWNRTLLRFFAW